MRARLGLGFPASFVRSVFSEQLPCIPLAATLCVGGVGASDSPHDT